MIFVSTRFPEDIPSFKASQRAVVADMSVGSLSERHSSSSAFIRCNVPPCFWLNPQYLIRAELHDSSMIRVDTRYRYLGLDTS